MWQLEFNRHRLDWQTTEWVGISGPSGCGKTQLLTHLVTGHNARLLCEEENPQAISVSLPRADWRFVLAAW